jgi:hypothetical protein
LEKRRVGSRGGEMAQTVYKQLTNKIKQNKNKKPFGYPA